MPDLQTPKLKANPTFPELHPPPAPVLTEREVVLWHRSGSLQGRRWIPAAVIWATRAVIPIPTPPAEVSTDNLASPRALGTLACFTVFLRVK